MLNSVFKFGEFFEALLGLMKYILIIPAFLMTVVLFLFEIVQMIPGPFGVITNIYLALFIGIYAYKLIRR